MSTTRPMSRSPLAVPRQALATAERSLPAYSSARSRHGFTQPQLFAVLTLKQFFKTDYRGIVAILADTSDLRAALRLARVPYHSTLADAAQRLLEKRGFAAAQAVVFTDAADRGLTAPGAEAAVDATGFASRYASRRYVSRAGYKRFTRLAWPKLTVVGLTKSHLLAGAVPTRSPSQDSPQMPAAVGPAVRLVPIGRLLGDAGYDAEHNHALCRERLGIGETVFALNRRNSGRRWPTAPYRRSMTRAFPRAVYNQRWQVERAFSRHKRRLVPSSDPAPVPRNGRSACSGSSPTTGCSWPSDPPDGFNRAKL